MRRILLLATILALCTVSCASMQVTPSLTFESARALNYDDGIGMQVEVEDTSPGIQPRLRAKLTNAAKNDGSRVESSGFTYAFAGGVQYNFPHAFLEIGYESYGYKSHFNDGRASWNVNDESPYYRAGFRWDVAELSATYFPPAGTIYDANTVMITYQVDLTIGDPDDWRNRLSIFVEPSFTTLTIPRTGERETRVAATFGMGWRF